MAVELQVGALVQNQEVIQGQREKDVQEEDVVQNQEEVLGSCHHLQKGNQMLRRAE